MRIIRFGLLPGFLILALASLVLAAEWQTTPEVFEPTYYADQNTDVRDKFGYDTDKLTRHWREYGLSEGRRSSPVFDVRYYLRENPDIAKSIGAKNFTGAAEHWYRTGIGEGRPSHPEFHVRTYLKDNPDVAKSVGAKNFPAAVRHYLEHGYVKGRTAA